jgi:amidase
VPASFCGIYGLRPTHGRIDLSGAMGMSPSFDVAGWFASGPGVFRNVGEVLLEGKGAGAPIESLIVAEDAFVEADPEVALLLREVLARSRVALPAPRHEAIAPGGLDEWRETFRVLQAREIWEVYGPFVTKHRPNFGPGIRERMAFAATVSASDAQSAAKKRAAAHEQLHARIKRGTILALPAAPAIAPLLQTPAAALEDFRVRTFRLTCIAGLSGLPQVTIPAGIVSGCPVGLSFIGWDRSDEVLLDLALRLAPYLGTGATRIAPA